MALFELDDIFGFQDANGMKTFWSTDSEPDPMDPDLDDGEIYLNTGSVPYLLKRFNFTAKKWETIGGVPAGGTEPLSGDSTVGDLFLNTNTTPPKLRYFNGTGWVTVSEMADSEILDAVKNVDGAGSGLDADLLDGLHGGSFIRSDADDTFTGVLTSTIASGPVIKFDNGHSMLTVNDGSGDFNLKSGVDENHLTIVNDGGSHIELDQGGIITVAVTAQPMGSTFTDDVYVRIHRTNGIILSGKTTVSTQLVIPQSQPSSLVEGSVWIA
jgi:hypothetical protein